MRRCSPLLVLTLLVCASGLLAKDKPDPRLREVNTIFVKGDNPAAQKTRDGYRKGRCMIAVDSEIDADAVFEVDVVQTGNVATVSGVLTLQSGETIWRHVETAEGALAGERARLSLLLQLVTDADCKGRLDIKEPESGRRKVYIHGFGRPDDTGRLASHLSVSRKLWEKSCLEPAAAPALADLELFVELALDTRRTIDRAGAGRWQWTAILNLRNKGDNPAFDTPIFASDIHFGTSQLRGAEYEGAKRVVEELEKGFCNKKK